MLRSALLGLAAASALSAPALLATPALAQHGPDGCQWGYVWRNAFPGDHVCVWPWVRDMVAADNAEGPRLIYADGICIYGYVWREAFPGDHVCVRPWARDQAVWDNTEAPYRRAYWSR